jgi:hypothetical protein
MKKQVILFCFSLLMLWRVSLPGCMEHIYTGVTKKLLVHSGDFVIIKQHIPLSKILGEIKAFEFEIDSVSLCPKAI